MVPLALVEAFKARKQGGVVEVGAEHGLPCGRVGNGNDHADVLVVVAGVGNVGFFLKRIARENIGVGKSGLFLGAVLFLFVNVHREYVFRIVVCRRCDHEVVLHVVGVAEPGERSHGDDRHERNRQCYHKHFSFCIFHFLFLLFQKIYFQLMLVGIPFTGTSWKSN